MGTNGKNRSLMVFLNPGILTLLLVLKFKLFKKPKSGKVRFFFGNVSLTLLLLFFSFNLWRLLAIIKLRHQSIFAVGGD